MTSVTTASSSVSSTFGTSTPPAANGLENSDPMANLIAKANSNNPLEAGSALRQLDSISGNRDATNNTVRDGTMVRDGTLVAENPFDRITGRSIDCADVPQHLPAVVGNLGISVHVGVGASANIGRFTAADVSTGRIYTGNFASGGLGFGVGGGVSATGSVTTVGRIPGLTLDATASIPLITATGSLVTDDNGNYEANSAGIGPGAAAGVSLNAAATTIFGCHVH
jgi:hypothetical protein